MRALAALARGRSARGEPFDAKRAETRVLSWSIGIMSVAGVLVILYATRLGPWVFSDSTEYIVAARNFVRGDGLGLVQASGDFEPLSLHPPLYPLALASAGFLGADLVSWARWLNALLFGTTIFLTAAIVFYATRSSWLSSGAALVVLIHPDMIHLYSGAMSEPLYFVLGFSALLLVMRYLDRGRRWQLVVAGAACGLTALTRYPGLAFAGAGVLALAILRETEWGVRMREALLLASLSAFPLGLWQLWLIGQGAASPRQWDLGVANLWANLTPFRIELVNVIWDWIPYNHLLPYLEYHPKPRLLLGMGVILGAIAILASNKIARRERTSKRSGRCLRCVALCLTFALLSVGIFAAVFAFSLPALDRGDVDRRMLLPSQIALLMAGLCMLDLICRAWPKLLRLRVLLPLGLLALGGWYIPQSWEFVDQLRPVKVSYTGSMWTASPTVLAAQTLPSQVPIITNESAALYFLLDRPSYNIPELIEGKKLDTYIRFGDGLSSEDALFREGAALVLFDTAFVHFYRIYEASTEERLETLVEGLNLKARTADGAIYFYRSYDD